MTGHGRTSWQNPRILLMLALVFLCGAIAGVLVGRSTIAHASYRSVGPYWKEGGKEISLQRFKKELDLTPEQAAEIEAVLDDFVQYYDALQSQMDGVRANGKERILAVLNPEQRAKFERMMEGLQSRQQIR